MKITLKGNTRRMPVKIEGLHYRTGKPVAVEIIGDTIVSVREIPGVARGSETTYVAPGLIDNQVNGYAGVDFTGDELSVEGVVKAAKAILKEGVTTFMPTLITNSRDNLIKNFRILDEACRTDELVSACIPGFHLEGPYISPEDGFRGCHSREHVRQPSFEEFNEYMETSGGRIIQVTVAPEVAGAIDFIRKCTDNGIIVALGHTNANTEQVMLAVENGARLSTHLGNGCANMIHRHYNPLWPQLDNDKLTASIIADGNHLLPEEIRVFLKAKGMDRIILTSDVVYLAGMKPGMYSFAGMDVQLREDGMLLNVAQNVLAGASFPLTRGVENMMKYAHLPLHEAVSLASAKVAGIYWLSDRGSIEPGSRADLILIDYKENSIKVKQTYKNGTLI